MGRRLADLLCLLKHNERRGSKPRCHLLTNGSTDEVAARLTTLVEGFALVLADDHWMPRGFADLEEAQLHKPSRLLDPSISSKLHKWWFACATQNSRTPNFDIASTCLIDGKPGLLLVEAKAHDNELIKESAGKRLDIAKLEDEDKEQIKRRERNHETIGMAIDAARKGLALATSLPFKISRDTHYQMSNRFAWSWKLTTLGTPVVLVYLGFLDAVDMMDKGRPFADLADWERAVKAHSDPLFSSEVWGQRWSCEGKPFVPLIRAVTQPLCAK